MIAQQDTKTDQPFVEEGGITTADLAGKDASSSVSNDRSRAQQSSPTDVPGERTGAGNSASQSSADEGTEPLFPADDAQELRGRWDTIQAGFVDEPRKAVEAADSLVAAAMKRLAETFANERAQLEGQWDRGDDVSTEDLRVALRRYRSFFGRLLSM